MRLMPLSEIIAAVLDVDSPSTQAVWKEYNALINMFGNEYAVLIDSTKEELCTVVDLAIAEAIISVREGTIRVTPGYDGIYGKIVRNKETATQVPKQPGTSIKQSNLEDFW